MVKQLILLLLPFWLHSGEFQASVSSNQVNLGESFTLDLTLLNSSAKGAPSLGAVKQAFSIHSQQQSSKTSFINGTVSSSTSWKFALIPQKEGPVTLPAISIDTSEGILTSEPITIHVGAAAASDAKGITVTTAISNAKPYKNEPLIYIVKLISTKNLGNIQMQNIQVEDAIVEMPEKPKIYESIINGMKVAIVEFSYILTPLKAGSLKIPSTVIQGVIQTRKKVFEQPKPFALTTDEVLLDVQPALAMNPWLPAKSLKIEESWNVTQQLHTGDPTTRAFKITAEGLLASQLPSLNDLQVNDSSFKVYADKPELGDEVKEGQIKSYRKEQYTLLPQQAGTLTLPEISLAWFDVHKKEKVFARVPSRTVEILPSPEIASKPTPEVKTTPAPASSPILYFIIAGLALSLAVAIAWIIALQTTRKKEPKKKAEKNEKLPDLNPTTFLSDEEVNRISDKAKHASRKQMKDSSNFEC